VVPASIGTAFLDSGKTTLTGRQPRVLGFARTAAIVNKWSGIKLVVRRPICRGFGAV
jgi:hypothetical protein